MDRTLPDSAMILDHLEQARRHVAEGDHHVGRQRERVSQLARDGHDTKEAQRLLRRFEELQALHVADRDRLERELAAFHQQENLT